METFYTGEQNVQMLLALLKAHKIRKIVASPGTTNISFVASVQTDPWFQVYSSVDERSAAYIACALASGCGEPAVLSCTGATASRNYAPGLTEAFYRKLPVLAVTSSQHLGRAGQYVPQMLDRSSPMRDICKISVSIPAIHDEEDRWACNVAINTALLELRRHGGGPVHINLVTGYSADFSVRELPPVRVIERRLPGEKLPVLSGRVAVFVGAHAPWSEGLTRTVNDFCARYDGVVLCDHTSNYHGPYRALAAIVYGQDAYYSPLRDLDVAVHIGQVSGAYFGLKAREVWRVNPDGEVRDTFKSLRYVFEMEEEAFFRAYADQDGQSPGEGEFAKAWQKEIGRLSAKLPELPFSNLWVARQTAPALPKNSVLLLGILNCLRSWNYFEVDESIRCYSNTGGFGIDGGVSTLLGLSLSDEDRLCFGVVGDLGFFYDMNALGNRHLGANLRLLLVNNGRGTEFQNYNHLAVRSGAEIDPYIAAAGHFGSQSPDLVRHFAQDLGFTYLCAHNKEEYLQQLDTFTAPKGQERPILFEVFTDSADESDALKMINSLETSAKGAAKQLAKGVLGEKGIQTIKKLLNR